MECIIGTIINDTSPSWKTFLQREVDQFRKLPAVVPRSNGGDGGGQTFGDYFGSLMNRLAAKTFRASRIVMQNLEYPDVLVGDDDAVHNTSEMEVVER